MFQMNTLVNMLCFHSDRLQEYKQKHLELKAAVRKELEKEMNGEEKSADQETRCGKEVKDGGSLVVEGNTESQQVPPVEISVESATVVSANGHVLKPAEHEEKGDGDDSEHSDRAAEAEIVNGETEKKAEAEESETSVVNGVESSAANGEMKYDATDDEMKPGTVEVNDTVDEALDSTASPSVLKIKASWADVAVSNAVVANGAGNEVTAANGAADVIADGSAEK